MGKRILCAALAALLVCMLWAPALAAKKIPILYGDVPVDLKIPGSYQSLIRAEGEEQTVLSKELFWDSTADVRFGYVYAPNLGETNLRLGPRSKASIVTKAKTGRIVLIFERLPEWTGVIYDGKIGYLMNATVKVIEDPAQPRATATLSYKGRTTGTTKINMHIAGNGTSRRVVGLRPGMDVTIFYQGEKWSEIECNGWHGWVLSIHLADIVDAPAAEPEATPEAETEDEGEDAEEVFEPDVVEDVLLD